MPFPETAPTVEAAATGRQRYITGDGSDITGRLSTMLAGTQLAGGASGKTFYYAIPTQGASNIDVDLLISQLSGTGPTAQIYKTFLDHVTTKGTASSFNSGSALASGTSYEASITSLRGEEVVILAITVPGSATVTFSRAEYAAL